VAATIDRAKRKVMLALSFASVALIYSLMLLGVYVTTSHQGLSCPDWPLCPNGFGIPAEKYLFEQIHRLVAVIAAATVGTTAAYAIKNVKNVSKTAIIAAAVISIQIGLGALIVFTKLNALIVATHLSTGVLLLAMALVTLLSAYRIRPEVKPAQ
jgi:cytochrome c oxidase assembly protein subunit 15